MRQAARIAINRTVAGVHFPADSAAGAVLGLTLGQYLVKRCTSAADAQTYTAWKFDGTRYPIRPTTTATFTGTLSMTSGRGPRRQPHTPRRPATELSSPKRPY